jgi:hypothetical protein
MLPFEDRWSRQRRLPEVGTEGQRRLASERIVVAPHPDLELELDYLERAGIAETRIEAEAEPLPFPFASQFEFAGPLSVARGAWCALARIRRALEIGRMR